MRLTVSAALALALAACSPPTSEAPPPAPPPVAIEAPSGTYQLDKTHSSLTVRALHFGLSHYTLRLTDFDATLNFDASNPAASTISASVNPLSLETDYVGERDFDAELQNSEWLNATEFPQATFQSTSVEITGPNSANVTGDLTIRGVTHPAIFAVTYNAGYPRHPMGMPMALVGVSAKTTIKRSQYGMNVLMAAAGDPASGVSDDVDIIIEAEFRQPLEQTPAPAAQ